MEEALDEEVDDGADELPQSVSAPVILPVTQQAAPEPTPASASVDPTLPSSPFAAAPGSIFAAPAARAEYVPTSATERRAAAQAAVRSGLVTPLLWFSSLSEVATFEGDPFGSCYEFFM